MEKSVQITLIITTAVVFLALAGITMFSDILPTNSVTGKGIATIKATPDLVGIYFKIKTDADTASKAKDDNAEITDNVITNLIKLGLERKDIQTQNYNLHQKYVWREGERIEEGYTATHQIRVEISTDDIELKSLLTTKV